MYLANDCEARVKVGRAAQGDGRTLCQLCSSCLGRRVLLTEVDNVVQVASLRRYIQAHDIQEVDPQSPKDELVAAVSRHWYNSVRILSGLEHPSNNFKTHHLYILHCLQSILSAVRLAYMSLERCLQLLVMHQSRGERCKPC